MYTLSFVNMFKLPNNPLASLKKTVLGSILVAACLNPDLALAQYNPEVQQLVERHHYVTNQVSALQTELVFFMLANPQPSAAVMASGAGIAAVLDQNLDSTTKGAISLIGMLGVSYCMDQANLQYCAQVATKLIDYASKLDGYNREANTIVKRIRVLQ
jgi:hypothetical protein